MRYLPMICLRKTMVPLRGTIKRSALAWGSMHEKENKRIIMQGCALVFAQLWFYVVSFWDTKL